MTDLSAYRERFAAVEKYEDIGRHSSYGPTVRDYADAALAALAKALGTAEAESKTLTGAAEHYKHKFERAEAELAELKARRCEVVVLPDYEAARTAEDPSPLDRFVVDNEPAGAADETAFRDGLQELVEWLTTTGRYERREG